MSVPGETTSEGDSFLDRAFSRILKFTLALSVAAVILLLIFYGSRVAVGAMLGSAIAYLNLKWLHHGADVLVGQMLAGGKISKARLLLAFAGRYIIVMAVAYAIFKSSLQVLYGFMGALFVPILAVICEGFYEALGNREIHSTNS